MSDGKLDCEERQTFYHGAAMHLLFCPKKLEECIRCQKIAAALALTERTPEARKESK